MKHSEKARVNSDQMAINEIIIHNWEKAKKEIDHKTGKRLRSCSAWVYETDNYFFLCSYNTIVAFIKKDNYAVYDVLRLVYGYTVTSAQHISKFRHDYTPYPWNSPHYVYRSI